MEVTLYEIASVGFFYGFGVGEKIPHSQARAFWLMLLSMDLCSRQNGDQYGHSNVFAFHFLLAVTYNWSNGDSSPISVY